VSDAPKADLHGAVIVDIEGTTTPIAFVTEVLFPYARRHLRSHLEEHAGHADYTSLMNALQDEHSLASRNAERVPAWQDHPPDARLSSVTAFVEWLMDRDRKSTALKELQGRIWQEGYQRGTLVGSLFPDVRAAFERWHAQRVAIAIFSSGSVLAQQLLFRYSSDGDLTGYVSGYFDTRIGPKSDPDSYRRIASAIRVTPESCMFLSDVTRELDAASAAGMQVQLVVRAGNAPLSTPHHFPIIRSFEDVVIRHE
jgi:enolase-phosphatase E1